MTLSAEIAQFAADVIKEHAIIHGDATTSTVTDNGLVPSLAKVLADMSSGTARGAWVTATGYALNDIITSGGSTYRCASAHTSGTFATDLAAGKWIDQTGSAIANSRLATMATQTFKGRVSAGTGLPEDLTAAQASALMTGLTNAQQTNMANGTIKGRVTAGAGAPEDLTASQVAAILSPLIGPGLVNRIINGDMRIDQRNSGASLTLPSSVTTYGLDRWRFYCSQASKLSTQQLTATPFTGFTHYQRITSLSAYTPLTGDSLALSQPIEGYNVSDLMWGTANAKPITLFLRVRSSLTGTFSGVIKNGANARAYPFAFSIPVANTETLITINVPGDTTGTWATDNTIGMIVILDMGSGTTFRATAGAWATGNISGATGAVNLVATNGATFDFTGVELYPGTLTSPPGAWRPYAIEFALCQRYWNTSYNAGVTPGTVLTGGQIYTVAAGIEIAWPVRSPVALRAAPSVTSYSNATGASGAIRDVTAGVDITGITTGGDVSTSGSLIYKASGGISGHTISFHYVLDAEL